jgi:putative ABC transport system permease protein
MVAQSTSLLLRAGLRYQLRHPWQLFLALIGVAMGVAVVLAVDMANDASKAAFQVSAEEIRGTATHRLVGRAGRLPEQHYADLFRDPAAPPMAPVITTRARIEGTEGRFRVVGVDVFAEGTFRDQLTTVVGGQGSLGDWLTEPGAAAISRSAATRLDIDLGGRLTARFEGTSTPLRIQSIFDDDSLASRDLVFVDIATAQALTGWYGEISHVDLALTPGEAQELARSLDAGTRLVAIDDQLGETAGLSSAFELNLTAMSLLALLVGLFLIFNAISFSIVQRRRLLGRLRAVGVTRTEIRRLVLLEAAMIAVVGSVLGTLLGAWLADRLTLIVAATISALYYDVTADALRWSPITLAKAWLLGIGGTLLAAWLPARQAAATPPLTTLSRAALESSTRTQLPRIGIAGAALVMIGLGTATLAPGGIVMAFIGLFLMLIGAAMISPLALRLAHLLLRRLPLHGVARMAVRDLDRHLSRLGTAGAALMVALAASVGVAVMVDSMRGAVGDWLDALLTADVYIASEAFEDGAPLPSSVVVEAGTLPVVTGFSSYRDRELQLGGRRVTLIAAELAEASRVGFEFVDRTPADPWSGFDAGEVLISEPLAYRLQLDAGDMLVLPTPGGDRRFAISAVFRDFASEHGRVFIKRQSYIQHWQDEATDTLALFRDRDTGVEALLDGLDAAFAERNDLAFTAAAEIRAESMRIFDRTFRITDVLRWLSIAVAFVGVFSALMALQLERRKEYAVLRALGLTRRQVSLLIVTESLALGIVAALLAMPVGLAMAWVLTAEIQLRAFGWSMPLSYFPEPYLTVLVNGAVAGLLASLLPAWRSAHQNPAPQLRED